MPVENILRQLILAHGPQYIVGAIGSACAELSTWAKDRQRLDIARSLRIDSDKLADFAQDVLTWDCSAIADYQTTIPAQAFYDGAWHNGQLSKVTPNGAALICGADFRAQTFPLDSWRLI